MKLVTFSHNQLTRVGLVEGDEIVDSLGDAAIPPAMLDFLTTGQPALNAIRELAATGKHRISLDEATLLAPVPRPGKYLGIGLNYADHITETGRERPQHPTFFTKQSSCVIGHLAAIHKPKVSDKIDYEGELAFVIGRRCRHVDAAQAHSVIAGFTVANDVTIRDWQMHSPTWTVGKSFDTAGPLGPWLVTADELGDPHCLDIRTWVDGDLRQSANTREMIFSCYDMVAYLSQAMTLEPGDVVTTGTPSGVGVKMQPRSYLKPGQTVRIEIEAIGALINPIINEP